MTAATGGIPKSQWNFSSLVYLQAPIHLQSQLFFWFYFSTMMTTATRGTIKTAPFATQVKTVITSSIFDVWQPSGAEINCTCNTTAQNSDEQKTKPSGHSVHTIFYPCCFRFFTRFVSLNSNFRTKFSILSLSGQIFQKKFMWDCGTNFLSPLLHLIPSPPCLPSIPSPISRKYWKIYNLLVRRQSWAKSRCQSMVSKFSYKRCDFEFRSTNSEPFSPSNSFVTKSEVSWSKSGRIFP